MNSELIKELKDIASKSFEHPEHGACTTAERLIVGDGIELIEQLQDEIVGLKEQVNIDRSFNDMRTPPEE